MKLSFSIKGWKDCSWPEFTGMARDIGFAGIEVFDTDDKAVTGAEGPLHPKKGPANVRSLLDAGLCIPCISAPAICRIRSIEG
jgi:hypothetical protein